MLSSMISSASSSRRRLLEADEIIELSIVARIDPPSNPHLTGLESHAHYVDHTIEKN